MSPACGAQLGWGAMELLLVDDAAGEFQLDYPDEALEGEAWGPDAQSTHGDAAEGGPAHR